MSRSARSRLFSWFAVLAVALLASLQGCNCGGTDVDIRRFPCTQDDECASGYLCRAGECRPEGEPVNEPDGGKADGGADGGGTTDGGDTTDGGGTTDGGTTDGGGTDGGSDAGTPDGGTNTFATSVIFVTDPQTVLAGACSGLVELEARDASGKATPLSNSTNTSATLGVNPAPGVTFYADPGCTTATSAVVFPAGATRAGFYFKGRTGGAYTSSVTPPGLPAANQTATILPVVRTGSCLLTSGSTLVTCPIAPAQTDMSKTLLVFQSTSSDSNPHSASVRCSLTALDAITCRRHTGGNGSVAIQWQTAELASGLKVQHLQASCDSTSFIELPIAPVSRPQETFLLVSSLKGGVDVGPDDFYTATLAPEADHLHLEFSTACETTWAASIQVVEFAGANVTRGETGAMSGSSLILSSLPAVNRDTTALLFTYRVSSAPSAGICDRVLRGTMTSSSSITFTRGAGGTGCTGAAIDAVSWQRIDFGPRAQAQHLFTSMGSNTTNASYSIASVDTTRTLVFATGQAVSGQAMGESSYTGNDVLGASMGLHSLTTPSILRVSRATSLGAAQWSSTVLQIEP